MRLESNQLIEYIRFARVEGLFKMWVTLSDTTIVHLGPLLTVGRLNEESVHKRLKSIQDISIRAHVFIPGCRMSHMKRR